MKRSVIQQTATTNRTARFGLFAPCLLILAFASTAKAQIPIPKNVLILNEVGLAHPASALVTQQVMLRLAADRRYQTEFYVESLDSPLFSDEAPLRDISTGRLEKYEHRKIDVIVAMGPASIRFLAQHPDYLPDVPVVFCGSTTLQAGDPALSSRFTGTWMNLELANTLDVARALVPDVKGVVVVTGSSEFDKGALRLTKASLDAHPVALNFSYLMDLDMSSLLERLRRLPSGTVVLYIYFFLPRCAGQPIRECHDRSSSEARLISRREALTRRSRAALPNWP